jgi:two-component system response regulator DesR
MEVLIVSELGLLRGALKAVLSTEHDLNVTELDLDSDVVSRARRLRPDVAVIDLERAAGPGLGVARQLADELPGCPVVALAAEQTACALRQALDARVRGFASKEQPPGELAEVIRRVAGGDRVIDSVAALAALAAADNPLTDREREVLGLAAEGLPTRAMARRLYLTEGTVRNHMSAALRKTGARNRLEAVRRAQDAGWLIPPD